MPLPKYTSCDNTYGQNQPLLKITPEKLCQMPYLSDYKCADGVWGELNCGQYSAAQMAKYNCMMPGFNGRPVHFEYAPESGPDWKNARCTGDACQACKQPEVL
jgi:hypothetical protein